MISNETQNIYTQISYSPEASNQQAQTTTTEIMITWWTRKKNRQMCCGKWNDPLCKKKIEKWEKRDQMQNQMHLFAWNCIKAFGNMYLYICLVFRVWMQQIQVKNDCNNTNDVFNFENNNDELATDCSQSRFYTMNSVCKTIKNRLEFGNCK